MSKKTLTKITLITLILLTLLNTIVNDNIDTNINISTETRTEFKSIFESLLGFLQTAGSIIAVVTILIIGIKYMSASTDERAEYKRNMVPYLVGAILVFSTVNIVQIVYNFMEGINS